MKKLEEEFRVAQQAFFAEIEKLTSKEEEAIYYRDKYPNLEAYAKRFFALADAEPKSQAAARALLWIVTFAPASSQAEPATLRIVSDHPDDEVANDVGASLSYQFQPYVQGALAGMVERTSRPDTRVWARYCLGTHLLRVADAAKNLRDERNPERQKAWKSGLGAHVVAWLQGLDPDSMERRAVSLLETAATEGKDVTRRNRPVAELADAALFELRELAIGKIAPEIEGEDIDGAAMKLSDYRGKVVVLDFWGNW